MKILTLDLLAYGQFTQTRLDFSPATPGLNIVYGANEAGKSTALRALIALLYGFPTQTTDNFHHTNKDLLIGGTLENTDGTQLHIRRRKGNKNTLLDANGQPVDERILEPMLTGVDKNFFQAMFAINHVRLRQGGEEIRMGGGQIGAALFTAGTGFIGLRTVAQRLQTEADLLFKYRGQKPRINELNQQCTQIRRKQDEQTLRGSTWQEHDGELRAAEEQLLVIHSELNIQRAEQTRLDRLAQALPHVAKRQELQTQLHAVEDAILLPPDFPTRRTQAYDLLETSTQEIDRLEQELAHLTANRQGITVEQNLLKTAKKIQDWYQKSGAFIKANRDLPNLEDRALGYDRIATTIIHDIRPELTLVQAKTELFLTKATRERILELANQHDTVNANLTHAQAEQSRFQAKCTGQQYRLAQLPQAVDTAELSRACERVTRAGDIEHRLTALHSKLAHEQTQLETGLKRLGGWHGDLMALESLALPLLETVEAFAEILANATRLQDNATSELAKAQASLADAQRQLDILRYEQAVPDEAMLLQARHRRNQGWQLVRRVWLHGQTDPAAEQAFSTDYPLPDAYEQSVSAADDIGDRLRREASRVQLLAKLQTDVADYQSKVTQLHQILDALTQDKAAKEAEWHGIWEPLAIKPRSPKEMRAWLNHAKDLRAQLTLLHKDLPEISRLEATYNALLAELTQCLHNLGLQLTVTNTLEARLGQALAVIKEQDALRQQQQTLTRDINQLLQQQHDAAQQAANAEHQLNTWRKNWATAVKVLGLEVDATPTQAHAVLYRIDELFKALKSAEDLRTRVRDIENDNQDFKTAIYGLCQIFAPDLQTRPPHHAIETLHQNLQDMQAKAAEAKELERQLHKQQQLLESVRLRQQQATAQLASCLQTAHCTEYAALPSVEARSTLRRELDREWANCRSRLLELSAGKGEAALLAELAQIDTDTIPGRIAVASNKITAIELEQAQVNQTIGDKRRVLQDLDRGIGSFEQAVELEQTFAAIRTAGERYVRLRLASAVLEQQIETYRRNNQTPLLNVASGIFSRLTAGAFTGLRVAYGDNDNQVLRGIRHQDEQVPVEGMSDGTCDQLYLALFLASIYNYLDRVKPHAMPLIVDDILIHYDDMRSKATLQVLVELAQHTQIIMFTHHAHLLELARTLGGACCQISVIN